MLNLLVWSIKIVITVSVVGAVATIVINTFKKVKGSL